MNRFFMTAPLGNGLYIVSVLIAGSRSNGLYIVSVLIAGSRSPRFCHHCCDMLRNCAYQRDSIAEATS